MRGRAVARASRTPLPWAILCFVALLVLSTGGSALAAPSRSTELKSVDVSILPVEPTALAMYAKQRGFFAKQGIDAKIHVLADPTQVVASVLSGSSQFSSLSVGGLATLKSRGAPVKLVAAGAIYDPKAATSALVAMPSKKITRARDLVGKLIAIDAENTIAHIGLLKWFKQNGVTRDQVRFTTVPFAQMLPSLTRGTVDAALLPEPYLTLGKQRGARVVAHMFDAVCAQKCLLTIWMAQKSVDPDLVARFRNAIQAAAKWANQKRNLDASARILAKYAPIQPSLIKKMTRSTFATRLRLRTAQPWIDVFAEFGVIPTAFPASDLVK
jgi:NitT/TauT family transport system substrate-binding protein